MIQSVRTDDGVAIEHQVYGSGPLALLFLHGWGNAASAWDDFITTRLNLSGLRCVAASYRGHGGSDAARSGYTHERFARDMFAVADSAGADRFVMIGFSMARDEQLVQASTEAVFPAEWLKDGSMTFLNNNGKSFDRLAPGAGAKPETLLTTEYSKDEPRVSPDGRWVAYNTDESGRWEVYIAAFPSFTARRQVSNNGGVQGYWRKDGKELFYLSLDGNMVSIPIKPGPALEAGIPRVLFPTRVPVSPVWDQFAVTGDGQRFLLLDSIDSEAKPFTIVLNWPAAVKR